MITWLFPKFIISYLLSIISQILFAIQIEYLPNNKILNKLETTDS